MSEEKEPTLIIKSEDLQDPKKLAFVKAIVGSLCQFHSEATRRDIDIFVGLEPMLCEIEGAKHFVLWENRPCTYIKELKIKISDIKLEPRLLIGEDVEVEYDFSGWDSNPCVFRSVLTIASFDTYTNSKRSESKLKPSLQWLKENFEVIEA